MDPSSPPPAPGAETDRIEVPTPTAAAAPPQVLRVVARPGGFVQAIVFVVGLFLFAAVFLIGLALGAATVSASSLLETAVLREVYRDGDRNVVAILPVEGIIDGNRAESVRTMVDHVLRDRRAKAAVLRVDSPGGGIAASDQIWFQIKRMRDSGLPVIASFGGLAASGGYYISCATDRIVAEPTCITGSIGVIAQTFILKDLMDKVGIEPVTLLATDSPEKDLGNPFRAWTEEDHAKYLSMLDAAYDLFNQRVRDGRGEAVGDPDQIDKLADGSIYTAEEAVENGLVDGIGYLDDAIIDAEKAAGLTGGSATVILLREPEPVFGSLLGTSVRQATPALPLDAEGIRRLVNELGLPRLMYLMR